MAQLTFVAFVTLILSCTSLPAIQKLNSRPYGFTYFSRAAWGAKPATSVSRIGSPVELVVIHHTYQPGICYSQNDCMHAMRSMQDFHQLTNHWADIGYNFAIGGEGNIYEGRGWDVIGAHAVGYNSHSVGIVFIGDFRTQLPPLAARQAAQKLIAAGVERGFISPNYRLQGHREVGSTECPGDALFQEIKTWGRRPTPYKFPFVSRSKWGAREPTGVTKIGRPADLVVIHHTYQPGICYTQSDCSQAMRSMQDFHQLGNGWGDIGYNFAVGGDGRVYEGRSWDVVGAHAVGFNSQSIGIAFIGDFRTELPPVFARQNVLELIATGVELGLIDPNYRLTGHRQLGATECPGDALFTEISSWNNFRQVIS